MSDVVELRKAGAGDAAAIRALTREAYAKWVPLIGREPRPMTADYAQALKTHRFDLLYAGGRLAALIEWRRITSSSKMSRSRHPFRGVASAAS